MTDQPALRLASQRKSARTLDRARTALAELEQAGGQVSFQRVARAAGVSRQWLYGHPELRARIETLRAHPQSPVRARQRSSDESLRQRLATAVEDNQQTTSREPTATSRAGQRLRRATSPRSDQSRRLRHSLNAR